MKHFYLLLATAAVVMSASAAPGVATFENLSLDNESYWAGDENGESWYYGYGYQQEFVSGGYSFPNYCIPSWYSWFGFAYSNSTSTGSVDYSTDQFNSCVGSGADGSSNYCVAYPVGTWYGETVTVNVIDGPATVPGFYITNDAWTVDAILNGDGYTGGGFEHGDYFKVTITALDEDGDETASRDFYLADYRYEDESNRYYVNDWTYVDLSQLGEAAAFTFDLDSSRSNSWGMTTPAYFCMDNFGAEGTETDRTGGATSGIDSASEESVQPAAIYTIQGIRVNDASRPGLYIINGKKTLVK